METWFDARFLAVTVTDYRRSPIRLGLTLTVGLLLLIVGGWRPALAWTVGVLGLEAALRPLARPLAEGESVGHVRGAGLLILQALLVTAWTFAGVILWTASSPVGHAAAMSFFAALLFYVCAERGGSPAMLVSALPVLAAPLVTPLLWPLPSLQDEGVILILGALLVGQGGLALAFSLPHAPAAADAPPRPVAAPRPAPSRPPEAVGDLEVTLESLEQARAEAEAANKAKSAFLAIMSHEIRTPLNGVLGMTQALAADPSLNNSQRQRLALIRQSGESLLSILNDILDLSKVEAGKLELEAIDFDLGELARGAHESFTALAAQKGLKCRLDIDPAVQGVYQGDPTRVRQILYNLISNALKFTDDGEIRVSIDPAPGGVRMIVADTGVGIEPAHLERLFERFEQADASSTRRYGGTGLGLSICRDLCGLMGGSITVESEPGQGTRFLVTLPLAKMAAAGPADAERPATAVEHLDASSLRVLAAEDNPANQMVLRALLAPIGLDPTMVDDGAQAVEAWSTGDFDLIFMDIQMPRMDGLTAARTIRAEEARTGRPRTPIIALTANAMAHQVEEYFAAGMDGHVPKPIDMASLYGAIEAVQAAAESQAEARDHRAARQG